jgi:hypothetical protein
LAGFRFAIELSPSDTHPFARPADGGVIAIVHRVRFGVMCSRPPCCVESIAAPRELRARPVHCRTTGPTCRGSVTLALPCRTYTPRHPWSDASLEVSCPLQRSLAALALSGAAGLRTIPLRRFIDPPARARRACWARRTCPASDVLLVALAVFRYLSGFVAMKLAWRTRFGPERSNRIRRVAHCSACVAALRLRVPPVAWRDG